MPIVGRGNVSGAHIQLEIIGIALKKYNDFF